MALVMLVAVVFAAMPVYSYATTSQGNYQNVSWSFEDGTIAPFTVVEGSNLNKQLVADFDYDWNINTGKPVAGKEIGKHGDYFINTFFDSYTYTIENGVVKERNAVSNNKYVGALRSPNFVLDPANPTITMQLNGNASNGVVVYDAKTGAKVGAALATGDSWIMKTATVTWNDGFTYTEGQVLYLQIEDNTSSGGYPFVLVDDIRFSGKVSSYEQIKWSFEDGTTAPFTATEGSNLNKQIIADFDYDWNINNGKPVSGKENGKDGKYFINTLFDSYTYTIENGVVKERVAVTNNKYVGALRSPDFVLDPLDTTITVKLGGNDANGAFVYDAKTGEKVGEAHPTGGSWVMQSCTVVWKDGFTYQDGQTLYIQIEDNLSSGGYPFVIADDICFKGALSDYQEISWDFEDGTIAPFTINSGAYLPANLVMDFDYDINMKVGASVAGKEIGKHGDYFINTFLNSYTQTVVDGKITEIATSGERRYIGSLRSPNFVLDPANPTITMQLNGNASNGVVVYDAKTGTKVGAAYGTGDSWVMKTTSVVWNDGFTYTAGQELYLQIEDNTNSNVGYPFVTVDNICFSGKLAEEKADEIVGASLAIASNLSVLYHVDLVNGNDGKYSMRFTFNGEQTVVDTLEIIGEKFYFIFSGISPEKMGDTLKAELLYDGKVVAEKAEYSVKEYATYWLGSSDASPELKQLLTDLLAYGDAAQIYKGYKTDALVSNGVGGIGTAGNSLPTSTDKANVKAEGYDGENLVVSGGVRFASDNKLYLTLKSTENVVVKVNGTALEFYGNTVYTNGIDANNLDSSVVFEIYVDGNLAQTVTYSVGAYVYAVKDNGDANAALAKALYNYGNSAKAYMLSLK